MSPHEKLDDYVQRGIRLATASGLTRNVIADYLIYVAHKLRRSRVGEPVNLELDLR